MEGAQGRGRVGDWDGRDIALTNDAVSVTSEQRKPPQAPKNDPSTSPRRTRQPQLFSGAPAASIRRSSSAQT